MQRKLTLIPTGSTCQEVMESQLFCFAGDIINATILGFENYVMHNQRKISVARNIEVREYKNEQIVEQEGK